jgi:hypothetical protein
MTPTSGDLIPLVGISPAEEQQFARLQPLLEDGRTFIYPSDDQLASFEGGYYVIAASRQDVDDGTTSGDFELQIIPVEEAQN